jgi:hypothetical protein
VPHDCGTALFIVGMYFLDPFLMKRRSPLDPVSSNTLIVFCLTISLLLTLLTGFLSPFRCILDQFRSLFFEFSHLFGLISNFLGLELHVLLLSPKTFSIATTAVTLPVLEFFDCNFISPDNIKC